MSLMPGAGNKVENGIIIKWNDQSGYMFVSDNGYFMRIAIEENLKALCWGTVENFSQEYIEILRKTHTQISKEEFNNVYLDTIATLDEIKMEYTPPKMWEQMIIPGIDDQK